MSSDVDSKLVITQISFQIKYLDWACDQPLDCTRVPCWYYIFQSW